MKKQFINKLKKQDGEVMLEASIILVSVIILLLGLLSISFMFYQQSLMTSVATEIASDVAKNCKFTSLEIGKDHNLDHVNDAKMFRMSFGKNGMEESHEERADDYVDWRLPLASLGLQPENVEVDCELISSGIGRAYVKVTLSQKTDFFLSGILELLEITDENTMFTSVAYAECNDLMAYTSMINFTQYGSEKLGAFNSVGNFYDSVKNLINNLLD